MRQESLLKVLLRHRHLQTHAAFTAAYEKTARELDRNLIGSAPGREQLQRWLAAKVKTTPRTHHCRVLERMFPGYHVEELLGPADHGRSGNGTPSGAARTGKAVDRAHPRPTDETAEHTGHAGHADRADRADITAETAGPGPAEAGHPAEPADPTPTARIGDTVIGSATAPMIWQGADQLESALDAGTVGGGRIGYLEDEADRLGVRVVRVPPATLLESSLLHLRSVHTLLRDRQPIAVAQELARTAAKLACVVAEILWNENQLTLATRWYHAAFRAATEAGDRTLADLALAGRTYIPEYTEHPRTVLANVDPRLSATTTASSASPAVSWLWAFKARAHARLGESTAFEQAVEAARETLDRVPESQLFPGIFSFLPEKLAFYEAHGRVELGDWRGAIDASERALAAYDPSETTEPTLTRLELASAIALSGDLAEACRLATRSLLDPNAYHSSSVVLQARAFDRRLGPTTRATAEWREFLSGIRPPQSTALAPSVQHHLAPSAPH